MQTCLLPLLFLAASALETKMALVFSRHGARFAESAAVDPSRRGQLTGNGLRMGYQLGKYLRQKYDKLLPAKFDSKREYVIASGMDRTRQFAQAVMLGVYDFGSLNDPIEVDKKYTIPEWKNFNVEDTYKTALPEGYQPVPVHSYYQEDNYVFEPFDLGVCPLAKNLLITEGPDAELIFTEIKKFLEKLKSEWDYTTVLPELKTHNDVYIIYDYLYSNRFLGKNFISEDSFKQLTLLYSASFVLKYANEQMLNFALNELTKLMLSYLEDAKLKIENNREDFKNFVLMVGHDVNIYMLFAKLGYVDFQCMMKRVRGEDPGKVCLEAVGYAASFVFEIYQDGTSNFVNFLINGEKKGFCTLKDDDKCSLADTIAKLKTFTMAESSDALMGKYCREPPVDKNNYLIAIIVFNVAAIAFLSFLIYRMRNKTK